MMDITLPTTDRARITHAFRALRKQGFECHANWQCCQTCGAAAMKDSTAPYAFYHRQDAVGFNRSGNVRPGDAVHIAFGGKDVDGKAVYAALIDAGLRVEWNGLETNRPAVLGAQK